MPTHPRVILPPTHVNSAPKAAVREWLANNGGPNYIGLVDNAISADIASQAHIIWNHSYYIKESDAVATVIRALGIPLPDLGDLPVAASGPTDESATVIVISSF